MTSNSNPGRNFRQCRAPTIVAALGLTLAGCAALLGPDLDNVTLVSVEVISAAPEGDTDLRDYFIRHQDARLVKARLSTKLDLAELRRNAVYLHSNGSLCPLDAGAKFSGWPAIHEIYRGRSIDVDALASSYYRHPDREKARPENGVYLYDIFFHPSRPKRESSGVYGEPDLEPYDDLVANPRDVCLQIAGADAFFVHLKSNVVIVPREAIQSAFR